MAVTLRRGNADSDAPASRNAGALPDEFPRRSLGTRRILTNLSNNAVIVMLQIDTQQVSIYVMVDVD